MRRPGNLILLAAFGLNLILWLLAWRASSLLPPASVLHYNTAIGIDFIGSGSELFTLPVIGSILLVGNSLIAALLRHTAPRAIWILLAGSVIVQILLLVSLALIWQSNQ